MIPLSTYRSFFTRTHHADEEDRLTILLMRGDFYAGVQTELRDCIMSDRIAIQKMLQRAIRMAEAKGQHGWADHCWAQLREIVKHDRHSPEQAGYARQALVALEGKSNG